MVCSLWFVLPGLLVTSSLGRGRTVTTSTGCRIAVNGGLPKPQPLLLKPGGSTDGFGFLSPSSSDKTISVSPGEEIRVSCAGSSNYLKALGSRSKEVTAVCVSGTSFLVDGDPYTFRELACNANPVHSARATGTKCYRDEGINIEIGFEVGKEFFNTIDVCFDETMKRTVYSRFDLRAGIGGSQKGFPAHNFVADSFFPDLPIENLYSRKTQRATISRLLGSTSLGNRYIDAKNDFFLSRGHLTAKADFVFGSQHRATYHYVNVAPQWQTLNGGNWNLLEQDLRRLAANRSLDLEIYTGTHGVTTLPNVDDVETELYLYEDENGNVAVPVPKLFWKVVVDPKTEAGVVLLGVNNPYIAVDKLGDDYRICDDVCSEVTWLTWRPKDVKRGISYCCDVDAFREVVDTLPPFQVTGLLT